MIGTIGSSEERFRGRDCNELSHVFPANRGLVLFAENSADQQECTQNHWTSSQIKDRFESFQGIVHKTCIWRKKETYFSFENRLKGFPEEKKRDQVFTEHRNHMQPYTKPPNLSFKYRKSAYKHMKRNQCLHSYKFKFSILVMQFQNLKYIWEILSIFHGLEVGLLCFSNPAVKLSLHEICSQRRPQRNQSSTTTIISKKCSA